MKEKERELVNKLKEYTEINRKHFELYCQERRDVRKEFETDRFNLIWRGILIVFLALLIGIVIGYHFK